MQPKMSSESSVLQERKRRARSAVSNGTNVLANCDGRSTIARRYRDIIAAVVAGAGGADRCSETKLALIRRFSAAACLAEAMEAKLVSGEPIDIGEHALLCSTLVRVAQRIGINRIPKNITPTLNEYLETNFNEPEDTAAEGAG
jgi:hypothetical protein